ncbi:MAG TPA: OmpA family protein [Polyangia bacterium]|nr:OmpA family protein [Polyangia bacterium]
MTRSRRGLVVGWLLGSLLVTLAASTSTAWAKGRAHAAAKDDDDDDDDEPKDFRFDFGLVGGWHFFDKQSGLGRYTDDPADYSPKSGPAFGARLGLNFNRYLTLEGEALWIPTRTVLDPGGTKIHVFAYRGSLLVHLAPPGVVRPFLLAGYGGMTSVPTTSGTAFGDTDDYIHVGVGLKIAFGDYVGLRLEGRGMAPPAILGKSAVLGDETDYHGPDFEALGTLYFNFGEVETIEKVVIQEHIVERRVPAPNPDPDGDGIAGKADKCPDVAEDKDGFEDDDGCPDPDNDGDGIPDVRDKCPDKAETVNGIDDDDGCPEIDTDGDGILGSRDKCPDEPETKNGYKDDDGCPDELPQAIKRFTGVIEGINFKSGRATLTTGSYALLDRAVAVLKDYPEVRLEISGHTDSRGNSDKNRDLSQARADAVKAYFIGRGIDANRLTAIGFGSDRPVADNKTDAGRSRNRRTEFRLLAGGEGGTPGASP